ncbi:hypothetical protein NQZ79_g2664 [Umbelopsis isabellina]|nr:hypothetical protein NQZ79_g2664 [Umbelopsis isabellina]
MEQQHNNHAFQAGFSKAKDEFEAGYKAAVNQHHGSTVGSDALNQQNVGGAGVGAGAGVGSGVGSGMPQGGAPQSTYDQQNIGGAGGIPQGGAQQSAYEQQNLGGTGIPQGGAAQQSAYQNYGGSNAPQGGLQQQAYDHHKSNLDQDPSAGGAYAGVQQQAYDHHKSNLDQDPNAGGAQGGLQQQAYQDHKQHLDQSTGPTAGGPTAGVTGGNLNNQLDEEAALHSGPPHGLGNKIKSKLPNHFNDGAKIPRELRDEGSGQTGPGPM